MIKRISIVVPCFNEQSRFPLEYWKEIIVEQSDVLWIFVDDGSTDSTLQTLQGLCAVTTAKVIGLPTNGGKGNAIRKGFQAILQEVPDVEILGYLDSDGAFSKQDVNRIKSMALEKMSKESDNPLDCLISSRVSLSGRSITRKATRHYLGRIIATFLTRDWHDAPYDTQSGFKCFLNSNSFRSSVNNVFLTKWFIDVELLTRIGINNRGQLKVWEEPLLHWQDVDGSKIRARNTFKILIELIAARRQVLNLLKERELEVGFN
jgi:dolichyl-phosphate beta-glucosyltransferase